MINPTIKQIKHLLFFVGLMISCGASQSAWAFPGMIRHGYTNCTACHVSPSGGGVLTPYGRELAGEVVSAWSNDGESQFLYGAFNDDSTALTHFGDKSAPAPLPSPKIFWGGDTRLIQTYQKNPTFTEKRFFLMELDVEGAYRFGHFTLDFEAGYLDSDIETLRHYLLYQIDDNDAIRIGKFKNNYGLNTDEHDLAIKRNLGWDELTETYNLEVSRLTDRYALYGTAIFGAPETEETRKGLSIGRKGYVDHGGSLRASAYFADHYEVGVSGFYGEKAQARWRSVTGPFAVLGFSPQLYYLGEIDFQNEGHWGAFDYQRLTYEPLQGFQLFLTQEMARPSLSAVDARVLRYGVGLQAFPRPHYEIALKWDEEQDVYDEGKFHPIAWLLLHFYL